MPPSPGTFSLFATQHSELGQSSLADVGGIVGKMLEALGHKAVWDPRNTSIDTAFFLHGNDGINLIIEGFTPGWIEVISRAREWGARFLILATEEPTPKGFNWGTQKDMIRRQEIFPEAAKHADGIIHLVPGENVTQWYSQFAPAAHVELGFAPGLLRAQDVPEPRYDFGFFGSVSPRRRRILRQIQKLGKSVYAIADFPTQDKRDVEMRKAKVILQIRKFDAMGLVSSSRCNTSLMIGRPVVPEPHDLTAPWNEVIAFPKTMDGFTTLALLACGQWRSVWHDQVTKFATKLTPERCIGEPLRRIGILP